MSFYSKINMFASGFCSFACLQAILRGQAFDAIVLGIMAICDLVCGILEN